MMDSILKTVRIKRANTDWWINEKAVVGSNGKTYIAYITDTGEIHIKEIDAKCSRAESRDARICRLNSDYSDEHNAPSVCIFEDGRIMVAYTGHNVSSVRYRITEKPYDIHSFGKEISLPYDGRVSYVQLFENTRAGELWLFCRMNSVNWQFRYSRDYGKSWSEARTFLHSEDGGLFYMNIRRQDVVNKDDVDEQYFFALYGHPLVSRDHTIRSGIFKSDGRLVSTDGNKEFFSLYEKEGLIDLNALDTVYSSPDKTTVRLLEVSPTVPLRVGFAAFSIGEDRQPTNEPATYYSATFDNGKWRISKPICEAGEFLAEGVTDGSQTYLGGMAYYFGVGDAGLFMGNGRSFTDRMYIARFDGEYRVLESYISSDNGRNYEYESTLRRIPKEADVKIWRPTVPMYAQDNLPVYWHEGLYTAYSGGWHSDAVMLIEYDD